MTGGRALLAASLAALSGCAARDTVATLAASQSDRAAYCQGSGPPILANNTCTGNLTQRTFARAACVCGDLTPGGDLVTDGFDSRQGPWAPGGPGGDLAANGLLHFGGLLQVNGNLTVGGGMDAGATLSATGDLDVGGALGRPNSAVTVGGSARINGSVNVASLTVAGSLTTPPGAVLSGTISASTQAPGPVSVLPPCPCGAGERIDVAGFIAQHQAANHDAAIGLAPGDLSSVAADQTLELPCGRFYLERIGAQGTASVTLRATGRTALFVGGGISVSGPLAIELAAPGAELDLFVAGPVNLTGVYRIGDPARPGALRVWLASSGAFAVPAGSTLSANLYAPDADLNLSGAQDLYGAVVVNHIANGARLAIHRDRSVDAAASACAP